MVQYQHLELHRRLLRKVETKVGMDVVVVTVA
jgi:hypothetical protein